uniref:Uncharacterized protein n=1 Tax=Anguilla anguilla TaxID=7936 RepID=A0A0E9VPV7_ANGAN
MNRHILVSPQSSSLAKPNLAHLSLTALY